MLPSPEEVFYNNIYSLINGLFIMNINNNNGYFCNQTKADYKADVIERAKYILREMERTKHLIIDEPQ